MPVVTKCPHCKSKHIVPDPPENRLTVQERIQFEKDWDARYLRGKK